MCVIAHSRLSASITLCECTETPYLPEHGNLPQPEHAEAKLNTVQFVLENKLI